MFFSEASVLKKKKCCFDYQIRTQWHILTCKKKHIISIDTNNNTPKIPQKKNTLIKDLLCARPVAAKRLTAHAQLTRSAFVKDGFCSCGKITDSSTFLTRMQNHADLLFSYRLLKPVRQRVRDQILQVSSNIITVFNTLELFVRLHCLHVHELLYM